MSNPKTIFQIEGGLIKRPFTTARYWPALQQQNRQRRAGSEALPFDNAEMNLEAANELMADILKVTFYIFITKSFSIFRKPDILSPNEIAAPLLDGGNWTKVEK